MLLTTLIVAALTATQPAPTAGAQATLVAPQTITLALEVVAGAVTRRASASVAGAGPASP